MKNEKVVPIVKGLIKHIPGVKLLIPRNTGGTNQARYCYSVWMRHLIYWSVAKDSIPLRVAELGPGDSLGIGFSALLSGVNEIHFFDVVKYWDTKRNLAIFDELIELFRRGEDIPDSAEYPLITPALEDYCFPKKILTADILENSLAANRIKAIRDEIADIDNPKNRFIKYQIPWFRADVVKPESLDLIYSQAVLEHVEDLDNTYHAMHQWLMPGGLMSHSIDFRSHGITPTWNGHWTFGDFEWQIVKGGKSFLINRQPHSRHIELHSDYGFEIILDKPVRDENRLAQKQMSKRFKGLSDDDLTASTSYVLSRKR